MNKQGIGTFVNEAHELGTSSLDIFNEPEQEKALIHGKTVDIYPTSLLNNEGPLNLSFHLTQQISHS